MSFVVVLAFAGSLSCALAAAFLGAGWRHRLALIAVRAAEGFTIETNFEQVHATDYAELNRHLESIKNRHPGDNRAVLVLSPHWTVAVLTDVYVHVAATHYLPNEGPQKELFPYVHLVHSMLLSD